MKPKKKSGIAPLGPTLKYLGWQYIAMAVMQVYRENESTQKISGFDPNADTWVTFSDQRQDIFRRVKMAWCGLAKRDFTWFPFSEDYVSRLYLRYRKRNSDELATWENELRDACGLPIKEQ